MPKDLAPPLRRSVRLQVARLRQSPQGNAAPTALITPQCAPPPGRALRLAIPVPPPQPVVAAPPARPPCNKAHRRRWRELILSSMEIDVPRFAYLIGSRSPEAGAAIIAHIAALTASHPELPPFGDERHYLGWVINAVSDPDKLKAHSVPLQLTEAATSRKAAGKSRRCHRREFNIMFFTPEHYGHLIMTIVNFYVDALPDHEAYPPPGTWVAENQLLFDNWNDYLATYRLPDCRRRRSPLILLDESKLQYIMPVDLNFQIFDKGTNRLVFRMVREFCPDQPFLDHGREVIHETVTTKKSIRLEDQGAIVQIGFTAGSRAAPEFGWARNNLSKKTDEGTANRKISSFMTGFWLLAKQAFKGEIADDIADFHGTLPHLHPNWPHCGDATHGLLQLPPSCGEFKWDGVELAPGCAVMVQRYARAVHREHQPHRWAISWTTLREGTNPQGGNFILAKYGILIRQSANSAFAWRPEEWHATTLALFNPAGDNPHHSHPTFDQHSVVFVTSPRIGTAYDEWQAANGSAGGSQGALSGLLGESGDEIYEY